MDPADTGAVNSSKEKKPETVGELSKMLGLLGYYRQYIPDFSRIAKPLYDFLKITPSNSQSRLGKGGRHKVNKTRNKQGTKPVLNIASAGLMNTRKY